MTHPVFDIAGRSALVTGSSRGIGRALATGLLEAGCTVVLNGRDEGRLQAARRELRDDLATYELFEPLREEWANALCGTIEGMKREYEWRASDRRATYEYTEPAKARTIPSAMGRSR